MTIIERIFRLRLVPPFHRLSDAELELIAESTIFRRYEPGRRIMSREKAARALFITVAGGLTGAGRARLPDVVPAASLLRGRPLTHDIFASPSEGATCLLISKGHFFTILHECPALTLGFIELSGVRDFIPAEVRKTP